MSYFKAVLFFLLATNTAYFAVAGTASKAIDAGAWLALLTLFEAEASKVSKRSTQTFGAPAVSRG